MREKPVAAARRQQRWCRGGGGGRGSGGGGDGAPWPRRSRLPRRPHLPGQRGAGARSTHTCTVGRSLLPDRTPENWLTKCPRAKGKVCTHPLPAGDGARPFKDFWAACPSRPQPGKRPHKNTAPEQIIALCEAVRHSCTANTWGCDVIVFRLKTL